MYFYQRNILLSFARIDINMKEITAATVSKVFVPDVMGLSKVVKELRPLCSALESVAKSLEYANQLLNQERAYSKGLWKENQELKLKLKDMEVKNSNLVDQISRDTRKAPLFNPSQNAKNEKIGDNGYNW